jgi:hypothetical protein
MEWHWVILATFHVLMSECVCQLTCDAWHVRLVSFLGLQLREMEFTSFSTLLE